MRITLYQNCILTDAYSEVFDVFLKDDNNKTALERYLETLPKTTYEVEDVFITNAGKFTFVAGDNASFYNFNYMKVEDTDNNITRYAFIETITIVNGLAVVNYIEDTWSNYASSMKIRNSLLTRSRIIDYGETIYGRMKIPFYTIGMPYESNERPKLTCCNNGKVIGEDAEAKKCNAIITIQVFDPAKAGEITPRKSWTLLIKTNDYLGDESFHAEYDSGYWYSVIQELVVASADPDNVLKNVNLASDDGNYTITSAYLIPDEFNLSTSYEHLKEFTLHTKPDAGTMSRDYEFYDITGNWSQPLRETSVGELRELTGYILGNDFKRIGIGTITQPISIVNNGTDIDVSIFYSADAFNFNVYIGVQGQLIEITDSFNLDMPIASQTAEVTQQQSTARAVNTLNGTLQMIGGATSFANGASTMRLTSSFLGAGIKSGSWGNTLSGAYAVQGSVSGIVGGATSFIRGLTDAYTASLPMFTTNKGITAKSRASINANYGIIGASTVPDNEAQVVRYTNESCYACNVIVDTMIFTDIQTGIENKYNVVMFDYVKLYGKFSQRIASVLREILTNGVKIWYDETAINE